VRGTERGAPARVRVPRSRCRHLTSCVVSRNLAGMSDTYKIAVVVASCIWFVGCMQQRPPEKIDESTKSVPINVSKAGGDIIQQQRIVNVSDGAQSLPAALWSVGGLGTIVAGYVAWLIKHHLRRRRQVSGSSSNSHTPVA